MKPTPESIYWHGGDAVTWTEFGMAVPLKGELLNRDRYDLSYQLAQRQRDALDTLAYATLKESSTMAQGNPFTYFVSPKKLTPRTTREKALVAQTQAQADRDRNAAVREASVASYEHGKLDGAKNERERGDAFMLKAIAAATSGKVAG